MPFLNEGTEVEHTLRSIRRYSCEEDVSILLINDASCDGVDYASIASRYNATLLIHSTRQGVAASRDRGVRDCHTPYILFLDAHMRLYDSRTIPTLIKQLEEDETQFLCCQSKPLRYQNGLLIEYPVNSQGAYIDLKTYEVRWHYPSTLPSRPDIPCVLGAAYATSKRYWLQLGGLRGLRSYGMDEQYISLKVYLEGGRCILVNECVAGHIYRNQSPYFTPPAELLHNKLFIAELLLPLSSRIHLHANLKPHTQLYAQTVRLLSDSKPLMRELIPFYQAHFTRSIWDILPMNRIQASPFQPENLSEKLHEIAIYLMHNQYKANKTGLFHGKMGLVIFLCAYARFSKETLFEEFADTLLDEIINKLPQTPLLSFSNGICGIGWGIQYLIEQGWLEGSSSELLADIDQQLMKMDLDKITQEHFPDGMSSLIFYVLSRLQFQEKEKSQIHFHSSYLEKLKKRAVNMLSNATYFIGIDIPYAFLSYLDHGQPAIVDTLDIKTFILPSLLLPDSPSTVGLFDGWAGKGILAILLSENRLDLNAQTDEY